MARAKTVRAPSAASLSNNLRLTSTTSSVAKLLGRLSRQALLDLVFEWLDDRNIQDFQPYLERDEDGTVEDADISPYNAAKDIAEVREAYQDLQDHKGVKKEVIDRIVEGDWRHGITLRQLAMADIRYLDDHPAGLRWTALELTRLTAKISNRSTERNLADFAACIPRVHTSTFLNSLQREISSQVKAHFYVARATSLPLTFLRIFMIDSPYQFPRHTSAVFADSSRVLYIAFPDSCPFIYMSKTSSVGAKPTASKVMGSTATDFHSLRRIVVEAIPKALSQPHERYGLKGTSLTAKSLPALLAIRGPGRSNSANGAFSIFADAVVEGSPLDPRRSDTVVPSDYLREHVNMNGDPDQEIINSDDFPAKQRKHGRSSILNDHGQASPQSKKRKVSVHTRFGTAGSSLSSIPLDRLDIRLLDPPVADIHRLEDTKTGNEAPDLAQPSISLTFSGADVIKGIRTLAELGVIQPERMPSWMTGEEAVSVAVVHQGQRVIGGSG